MKEREIQNAIRLKYSRGLCRLFNNDNGRAQLKDGRVIKYGLAVSSPDLIGWHTITITSEMVGKDVAIFIGAEVKIPRKRATPEQQMFLDLLKSSGAISGVVCSEGDFKKLVDDYIMRMQS